MSKLKIYILSNDDLTSNLIFSSLLENQSLDIKGIAFTGSPDHKTKGGNIKGALNLLRKMSFRYWLYLVFVNGFFKIYEARNKHSKRSHPLILSIARNRDISIRRETNFNSPEFLSHIEELRIDVLVIRINQILRTKILNIPRIGTICVHSSLLPEFGGIAAEFHSMKLNKKMYGTSIFKVEEKIDTGEVLSQKGELFGVGQSCFQAMIYNNILGANLLNDYVSKLINQNKLINLETIDQLQPSYFSWPQKEDLQEFYGFKKNMITFKEAFAYALICCGFGSFTLKKLVSQKKDT